MTSEIKSHQAHSGWFAKQYADDNIRKQAIENWLFQKANGTINYWIHHRLFTLANPLIHDKSKTWLTVGDGYGFDAQYFTENQLDTIASDISDTFLPISKQQGLINKYSVENVESLSFDDNSIDYVFCKEAFHHFPRPYLGVYEMLRVAREAVILIEPHDPISKMPFLLGLRNILDRFDTGLLQRFWKNRYSFEEVGNYVFKLSEREIDKLANGIGLPMIAFKGINNNYYHPSVVNEKADSSSEKFRKISRKLILDNLLTNLSLMPSQVLCAIIFKRKPTTEVIEQLNKEGFQVHYLPPNPYLKAD